MAGAASYTQVSSRRRPGSRGSGARRATAVAPATQGEIHLPGELESQRAPGWTRAASGASSCSGVKPGGSACPSTTSRAFPAASRTHARGEEQRHALAELALDLDVQPVGVAGLAVRAAQERRPSSSRSGFGEDPRPARTSSTSARQCRAHQSPPAPRPRRTLPVRTCVPGPRNTTGDPGRAPRPPPGSPRHEPRAASARRRPAAGPRPGTNTSTSWRKRPPLAARPRAASRAT